VSPSRLCSLLLVALVALLAAAPSAQAELPGSNGWIEVLVKDQVADRNPVIETLDWQTGADASPPFAYAPARTLERPLYLADGLHVLAQGTRVPQTPREGIPAGYETYGLVEAMGAVIGEATNLPALYASTETFPGGPPSGERLCRVDSEPLPLSDGTILWRRFYAGYHRAGTTNPHPCNDRDDRATLTIDYVVTDTGGRVVRTSPRKLTGTSAQLYAAAGHEESQPLFSTGDADVFYGSEAVYATRTYDLYRYVISTGERTLVRSLPFEPTDVSATGATAIGESGNDIVAVDLATGAQRTVLAGAAASALAPAIRSDLRDARFSPDNGNVLVVRNGANEAGGFDALVIVGADGSKPRVLKAWPAGRYIRDAASWRVAPGFAVELTADQLVGDFMEVDVKLSNALTSPIEALEYATAGPVAIGGLQFNVAPFEDARKLGYAAGAGPAPALAGTLGAGASTVSQYLVQVTKAGSSYLRAVAAGTPQGKARVVVPSEIVAVQAVPKDLAKWEQAATTAGAYAKVQEGVRAKKAVAEKKVSDALRKAMRNKLPKPAYKKLTLTGRADRALSRMLGLSDDALSWLPDDAETYDTSLDAFMAAKRKEEWAVAKEHLKGFYNKTIQTPLDYWRQQINGDPALTVPTGTALYEESLYWQDKARDASAPWVQSMYNAMTSEQGAVEMADAIDRAVLRAGTGMEAAAKAVPGAVKGFAANVRKHPEKAGAAAGKAYGRFEGEVQMAIAESLLSPSPERLAKGITSVGKRVEGFMKIGDEAYDTTRTLRTITDVTDVADDLPTAAKLGMGGADQGKWSNLVAQVEASAKQRFGVDLNLQLSFRPRNAYSAEIKDGVGKNFFVKKIKAGDDVDLLLGMHPDGLGKAAVYKPRRPANFKDLPADLRAQLDERFADMTAGWNEWHDKSSTVYKARRAGGTTATATIGEGKATGQTLKVKMQLDGVTKGETVLVQYRELVVDGRTIVKRGSKPRWMVSDYDGNAILQASGAELPGGAVRSFVELEVMRLQRELGATGGVAVSFHGFTQNGFDVTPKTYRAIFKFLLEGMTEKQARQALDLYLKKFGEEGYDAIYKNGAYKHNDFVVRVTRTGATVGHGY
jgi:hypothetical protein